jgi:hypothetical protein
MAAEVVLRPRDQANHEIEPSRLTDTEVEIEGRLLNPGDSLLFQMLLDSDEVKPRVIMQAAGFNFVELPPIGSFEDFAERQQRIRLLAILTLLWSTVATLTPVVLIGILLLTDVLPTE